MYSETLTLYAPTPQNGQTYSNNLSAIIRVFDHLVGLVPKGLITKAFSSANHYIQRLQLR